MQKLVVLPHCEMKLCNSCMTLRYHRPVVYGEFPYGHFLKGIAVTQSRTEGHAMKINDLEDDQRGLIYMPFESCPHWSTTVHKQPLSQVKAALIRRKTRLHRDVPSDDRAGLARSRVELRRFLLLTATYRRFVQRCDCGWGESMCGVLVVRYLHNVHGPRQCGLALVRCEMLVVWCT